MNACALFTLQEVSVIEERTPTRENSPARQPLVNMIIPQEVRSYNSSRQPVK